MPELTDLPLSSAVRTLEETERNQILKILSETRWRIEGKDKAAAILGLHPFYTMFQPVIIKLQIISN